MMSNQTATTSISTQKPWLKYFDHLPDERATECSVYAFLKQHNQDYPNDIALNYFDHRITFGEMFQQIQKTAAAYLKLGVKKGDIVSICSVTTPEVIYSFYALDMIGATANMIDPRTSTAGVHEYLLEVHSKVAVSLSVAYPRMKAAAEGTEVEKIIVISPADSLKGIKKPLYKLTNKDTNSYDSNAVMWKDFIAGGIGIQVKEEPYDPNHCIVIVHTGGTTGVPKGVMLPDKAFNVLAVQYTINNFERRQKFLDVMPPFIAYGFACGVHMPLIVGVEVVIIPQVDPEKLGDLLLKYKPTHMAGVPMHYITMIKHPKLQNADLSFLKTPGVGGDAMNKGSEKEVVEFLRARGCKCYLTMGYGMTECCSTATTCMGEKIYKEGSVGVPVCLTTVSIFDEVTGEELGYNQDGEICVLSPNVMLGYYNNEKETANVLRRHADGKVWLHTGDIGHMDEDGFVYIASRTKRIIIRHDGFKIFPPIIENAISKHEAVDVCSAVGAKDPDNEQGRLPVVFIVLYKGYEKRKDEVLKEVKEICEKELPEYMQPMEYRFVDKLPYTLIGKVDYRTLEAEAASH